MSGDMFWSIPGKFLGCSLDAPAMLIGCSCDLTGTRLAHSWNVMNHSSMEDIPGCFLNATGTVLESYESLEQQACPPPSGAWPSGRMSKVPRTRCGVSGMSCYMLVHSGDVPGVFLG